MFSFNEINAQRLALKQHNTERERRYKIVCAVVLNLKPNSHGLKSATYSQCILSV